MHGHTTVILGQQLHSIRARAHKPIILSPFVIFLALPLNYFHIHVVSCPSHQILHAARYIFAGAKRRASKITDAVSDAQSKLKMTFTFTSILMASYD